MAEVREYTLFSGLLPCHPKGVSVCSVVKGHLQPASSLCLFHHGEYGNRLRRTRKEVERSESVATECDPPVHSLRRGARSCVTIRMPRAGPIGRAGARPWVGRNELRPRT